MKKIFGIIIAIIILILGLTFMGFMLGFPWERMEAETTAKNYVAETYGLTPTKAEAHFLFDVSSSVGVSTKELPFKFEVGVGRNSLNSAENDDYIENLFEYELTQFAKNSVEDVIDENIAIHAHSIVGLTRKSPNGLSIESINKEPEAAFEKMQKNYSIAIYYNNVNEKNFNIDNEKNYSIIKKLLESLEPSSFYISYSSKSERFATGNIEHKDFAKIESAKDLDKYFKLED